ncbi:MAG TPA: YqgE/AlgH family protein [Rhabdochlamydiaceae bacterium]|nr:YqgE/AlgH family protein [Rhabdochlamydiaceae bacterium]
MENKVPYAQLNKGTLLIASPDIDTGIYFRGVVILCEHGPTGSFGIVVNKPLEIDIPQEILNTKEIVNPHIQMRAGGALQPNQMMLLHSSDQHPENTLKLCEGVYLGGDLQFLQEAITDANGPSVRLCFGYCGWGPGQLEREFLSGLWFPCPGSSSYVFDPNATKLWQRILRDMGGKYATLSMIPDDLSLN